MIIMMDQIIHFGFCPVGFIPPTIRMKVTMMIPELMRRRMEAMVISQFLPNFILNMLKRYDKSIYSKNIGVQAHTPCTFGTNLGVQASTPSNFSTFYPGNNEWYMIDIKCDIEILVNIGT